MMVLRFILICLLFFTTPEGCSTSTTKPQEVPEGVPLPYTPPPRHGNGEFSRLAQYVTMRDGTKLAIDVYVPERLTPEEAFPTILHQTRYWRSWNYRWPVSWMKGGTPRGALGEYAARFLEQGYAWVSVDVRGTGASYGSRRHSHTREEVRDGAEIVDWIIQQPWSDGKVGTLGMSYDGTSAELLLVNQHPAVKAAAPMFASFDAFREIAFPGGVHLTWFTEQWSKLNHYLDQNRLPPERWIAKMIVTGVSPVDRDSQSQQLLEAIQDHDKNWNPHHEALGITFRDDPPPSKGAKNIDVLSPHSYIHSIRQSQAAVYSYSGWFDGAYPQAAIRRFLTLNEPKHRLILGPWDHGGHRHISPFHLGKATFDHIGELLKFFDFHLKGMDNGLQSEPPVHYFTMGEERWKAANSWPPASTMTSFFLGPNGKLSTTPPATNQGEDKKTIDDSAGTGEATRWNTLIATPIPNPYPDRLKQDRKLQVYSTAPLEKDIEVTGHPMATLFVSSTAEDGIFITYLEDVTPEGEVAYVTEGLLRGLHRRNGNTPAPYVDLTPYRSFSKKDGALLEPGKVEKVEFALIPTSYLFKQGHRIRIALAGADKDHFPNIPASPPTVTYLRSRSYPSRIDLPIIPTSTLQP